MEVVPDFFLIMLRVRQKNKSGEGAQYQQHCSIYYNVVLLKLYTLPLVKWIVFSSKEVPLQHKKKEETRCRKPVNNKKTGGAGKARMDYYSIITSIIYIY